MTCAAALGDPAQKRQGEGDGACVGVRSKHRACVFRSGVKLCRCRWIRVVLVDQA